MTIGERIAFLRSRARPFAGCFEVRLISTMKWGGLAGALPKVFSFPGVLFADVVWEFKEEATVMGYKFREFGSYSWRTKWLSHYIVGQRGDTLTLRFDAEMRDDY